MTNTLTYCREMLEKARKDLRAFPYFLDINDCYKKFIIPQHIYNTLRDIYGLKEFKTMYGIPLTIILEHNAPVILFIMDDPKGIVNTWIYRFFPNE
jgi:hypothetical protein